MYITQYLKEQVDEKLSGNAARFDELWELAPNFSATLRRFDSDSSWLHWSRKTFDGWYCVESRDSGFEVYFQERGVKDSSRHFDNERAAIRFAINTSVFDVK